MCEKNTHKSVGQRLRDSIKYKGMSFREFSDLSDIPYRTLQQYLADERMPGGEMLIKIHAQLSISTDWLLTGDGPMYIETSEMDEIIKKLSSSQHQLLLGIAQEMLTVRAIVKKLGLDEEG